MSKYDVMCFYFSEDTKKVYPYSFVFFCGPFKQFGLLNFKGKKSIRGQLLLFVSIERLNAILFDDDCYEKSEE